MQFKGKARRFKQDNDINTDYIISGRYKFKIQNPKDLAKYVMEDLDPDFYERRNDGDFIVAGKNFGCGSSREQAPQAIKYANISVVIAKSFARIFFRICIDIGLPVVIGAEMYVLIDDGDILEGNLAEGKIINVSQNRSLNTDPLPQTMRAILEAGGLINYAIREKW